MSYKITPERAKHLYETFYNKSMPAPDFDCPHLTFDGGFFAFGCSKDNNHFVTNAMPCQTCKRAFPMVGWLEEKKEA